MILFFNTDQPLTLIISRLQEFHKPNDLDLTLFLVRGLGTAGRVGSEADTHLSWVQLGESGVKLTHTSAGCSWESRE